VSEESLKPRDYEMAKGADRPSPKGRWVGSSLRGRGRRHPRIPAGVQAPTEPIHILFYRQRGKPDTPHFGGIPTAREGDGVAGKRGRRKRRPPCNGADRAATAERPDPKGCRLPTGPDVGNLSDLLTLGDVRRWNSFHRTDLGTTSRLEEIHESGSTHQGSSRMRGNSHVRFLGGWGQATVPGYPRGGRAVSKAKGDRWSDNQDVEVREMRSAETVLGVIRERGRRGLRGGATSSGEEMRALRGRGELPSSPRPQAGGSEPTRPERETALGQADGGAPPQDAGRLPIMP
jgi:hypothetical protein